MLLSLFNLAHPGCLPAASDALAQTNSPYASCRPRSNPSRCHPPSPSQHQPAVGGMCQPPSSSRQPGRGGRGSSPSRRPRRHLHPRRALPREGRPCPRGPPALRSPGRLPRCRHRCITCVLSLQSSDTCFRLHTSCCAAARHLSCFSLLLPNSTAACVLWALEFLELRPMASCCLQEEARFEPEPESEEHRTHPEPAAASQQQQPSGSAQQTPSSRQQPMNWAAMARTAADKPASESGGATRKPAAKKVRGAHPGLSAHLNSYTGALGLGGASLTCQPALSLSSLPGLLTSGGAPLLTCCILCPTILSAQGRHSYPISVPFLQNGSQAPGSPTKASSVTGRREEVPSEGAAGGYSAFSCALLLVRSVAHMLPERHCRILPAGQCTCSKPPAAQVLEKLYM